MEGALLASDSHALCETGGERAALGRHDLLLLGQYSRLLEYM
jgi:hypothetical protein